MIVKARIGPGRFGNRRWHDAVADGCHSGDGNHAVGPLVRRREVRFCSLNGGQDRLGVPHRLLAGRSEHDVEADFLQEDHTGFVPGRPAAAEWRSGYTRARALQRSG